MVSFLNFVRESVVSGLATSFVVLLWRGMPINDDMVATVPNYTEDQCAWAMDLAHRLQVVVEEDFRNSKDAE